MRAIIVCLLLSFCLGCSDANHIPKDILPKEEMQKILWDMIQADQFSTQYLVKDSARINVKRETMKLYAEVFQIHHVSKSQFEKSFQFYLDRPDLNKIMFDSLSAQANRLREEVYRKKPPAPLPAKPQTVHNPA